MHTELIENCPVCNGSVFENSLTCEDHTSNQHSFNIQKCPSCNLQLTNPRPDQNTIGQYYQSPDYISHTGKSNNIFDLIYLMVRSFTLKRKSKLISRHKKTGNILDYGCGTGEFLKYMLGQNWKISGVEPSALARNKANLLIDDRTKSIVQDLSDLPKIKYDIITLWHVLEHVPDPGILLAKLKAMLNKEGIIFIALPNYESHDAQHYKQYWAGYDVPRHFWHFTQTSIQKLLVKHGFNPQKKVPLKLDAYYVSLLSEKYKNNRKHSFITSIKGFTRGLISNAKAKRTMNYSSLIYIAHHA